MEDSTLTIIKICKGGTEYNVQSHGDILEALKIYLSDTYIDTYGRFGYVADRISFPDLFTMLINAEKDYIKGCNNIDSFYNLFKIYATHSEKVGFYENYVYAITNVFACTRVMDDEGNYVNGFDERILQK